MKALMILAGPAARARLRTHGLRAADVRVIPGAAGGPKGLVLNPLDRFIFGRWLASAPEGREVHLLGASIGAWRLASACLSDSDAALARLAHDYVNQRSERRPGAPRSAQALSDAFAAKLAEHFSGREQEVLSHPRYRLHVFTTRGRHRLLHREGRWRTPLGYMSAFVANAVSRQAMGSWLERVVFSDRRDPLPMHLRDYRTQQVALTPDNLQPSVLASCTVPFWLKAVQDIPGAPPGAYWDGGISDYHLHLDYASMEAAGEGGLVLYPHFQRSVIPGWLDKGLKHRHRATERLSNVVLLAPHPDWVARLPNGKLPDRSDFKTYEEDFEGRVKVWSTAVAESQRLADEFAELVARGGPVEALPL